jgi:uncharacterized membrane protein
MIFDQVKQQELKKYTYAVYILQALSFVTGVTAIIAIVINYVKDEDARGSWIESHFQWQKRTFWFGLLWASLGALTVPILIGYLVLPIVTIWLIYRIARGWVCLVDGKQMYLEKTRN